MGTDFAAVARLLASPARAAVIDALLNGRALAAGELATLAGVGASTISEHLSELVDGGLVTARAAGRHRYYQLAGQDVAEALEALARICPASPVRSLRQSSAAESLRLARLCYDHLAGALGVALLDSMLEDGWLASSADIPQGHDFEVTRLGQDELGAIGVDVAACRARRRVFARSCLDWSQRRMHLAGAIGAGLAAALLDRQWLRHGSSRRGLSVTELGSDRLRATFGIDLSQVAAAARAQPLPASTEPGRCPDHDGADSTVARSGHGRTWRAAAGLSAARYAPAPPG